MGAAMRRTARAMGERKRNVEPRWIDMRRPPDELAEGAGLSPRAPDPQARDRIERRARSRHRDSAYWCAVLRTCQRPPVLRGGGAKKSRTGDGSRASASAGRRTGKEGGTPAAKDGAFVEYRGRGAERNQDDDSSGYRDRNNGMKDNAKGTVVCVGFERVGVRHLDNGEQGKQDEAQNGGGHHGTGRRDPASSLLEVVQEYL